MKNRKLILCAIFPAALLLAAPAIALDGLSVEAGRGDGASMWRAGAQWKWHKQWFTGGRWHLGGYWDVQLGRWKGDNGLWDIGITPVFRWQQSTPGAFSPYLEAAIGFHLLSRTRISDSRRFGSAFQFGDHLGAGVRFGGRGRYDLAVRIQHLSNAGLRKPNHGINFWQLRLQRHFD
jgi:lipid A 3-O-deacylase